MENDKQKLLENMIKQSNMPKFIKKNVNELPDKPGRYNITIDGVRTMLPMFAKFDGEKWVDLKQVAFFTDDMNKIHYYIQVKDDNTLDDNKKNSLSNITGIKPK